ncbi:MAG: 3'(2'),5'-bisphosphate nucleotidase CysQ [Pseudomonadales bacterium]|nr:3'(2'),5'-bisphosphate nucleotidase CysQ [Pseudomonadales bacterium]
MLEEIVSIAISASDEIMSVYAADFAVRSKQDRSPVTDADTRANTVILQSLERLTPDIPILSEESATIDYSVRRCWNRYWLVDPLDGTREFIKRNGEFTVNIALIESHQVTLGVVVAPVQKLVYLGHVAKGRAEKWSFRDWFGTRGRIIPATLRPRSLNEQNIVLLTSRSHVGVALEKAISNYKGVYPGVQTMEVGSSLKLCLLADGQADLYPKLGKTSEWDIAAGQAILQAAGGVVLNQDCCPLRYNTKPSLLNPNFIAVSDPKYDWRNNAPYFF